MAEVEKAAEAASESEAARRLWSWLAEVPGEGAARAKAKLESLTPAPKD